ncbi:hypothetical protein NM208_g5817 [Fusarium decemcellulare]|uniref:Uncharacterized protein n=1 Tax=Fusarium decemcellulare TaxID=57161 RepID=A0ACC1SFQ6_9HYPO|nr:hypothetical protein NM208_g5817 [Fusarium decemcellulare]
MLVLHDNGVDGNIRLSDVFVCVGRIIRKAQAAAEKCQNKVVEGTASAHTVGYAYAKSHAQLKSTSPTYPETHDRMWPSMSRPSLHSSPFPATVRTPPESISNELRPKLVAISGRPLSSLPDLRATAYSTLSADDFADEGPPGQPGYARRLTPAEFTDVELRTFHGAFAIWACHGLALDRTGHPLYYELALREDTALDGNQWSGARRVTFLREFFKAESMPNDSGWAVFTAAIEAKADVPALPVFVFSEVSHPRGTLPHAIVTKGAGRVALAVMLSCVGRRPVVSMASSPFTPAASSLEWQVVHVQNCIINERKECLYESLSGYLVPDPTGCLSPDVHLAGRDRGKVKAAMLGSACPPHPVRRLERQTAPRITCKLTSPYLSPEEKEAAISEAKEMVLAISARAEGVL